jgi:cytochrome c-type biogenesis protein CcsB
MKIEILFQNGIFLSLFLSMISFWSQNLVFDSKNKLLESPVLISHNNSVFFAEKFFSLSFVLITFELIYRWFLSGHPPLSNLYESLLFLLWGVIGFFLFIYSNENSSKATNLFNENPVSKLPNAPPSFLKSSSNTISNFSTRNFIGSLLSSTALFIQTFADWRLPSEMREIKPLIPALQSNWLLMHVSIMILSYAALLIGCIIAITYLVIFLQSEWGKSSQVSQVFSLNTPISPDGENSFFLAELDSLSYRILAFAFPLLTLGILSGAVWANEAWGSYWSWDPKETWAFITWLVFAFYLHTRLQYGWEGKKSATVATFGFFIVWICYLGVNLLGKGLHSYGWLS